MRGILLIAMFTASLAYAASHDYVEARDLRLSAEGISEIQINSGAGNVELSGVEEVDEIVVTATISVPTRKDSDARKIIRSDMVLTLEKVAEKAVLVSNFEPGLWGWDGTPEISLDVQIPKGLNVSIDDGSGRIRIQDVRGDIVVDDGPGSIAMIRVGGNIRIDDGSGAISVKNVGDSVSIVDGSGSITVREVDGSVFIEDGSGGIDISDVMKDLIIEADRSGSRRLARIQGRVEQPD